MKYRIAGGRRGCDEGGGSLEATIGEKKWKKEIKKEKMTC